jgi:hypothetical protein
MDKRLENYVDVPQRIKLFYEKYPEGSLQMDPDLQFQTVGDQVIVIGRAYAYRNPTDEKPGVGTAQEYLPGKTNFTRGSEIQNLETSCWGRAIGALGIGIDKAIATKEEVQLAIERNKPEKVTMKRANPGLKQIVELLGIQGITEKDAILAAVRGLINREISSSNELTDNEIELIIKNLAVVGS